MEFVDELEKDFYGRTGKNLTFKEKLDN